MNAPPSLADAGAALARGQPDVARELAAQLTTANPAFADAWLLRAVAAMATGRLDEAHESFAHLRELSPDDPRGPAGLGEVARARGDVTAALALLHEAARRKPAWSEPSLRIGEALRASRPVDAASWFLRAALGEPPQAGALAGLIGCAMDLRGQPIAPRELHLPRPLPRVTIVRSDDGGARSVEVRDAIARHVLAAFPDTEVLEPDAPHASRAMWLNRAISRAHGDVVVVLRGDVAPLDAAFLPAVLEELMYADLVGALGTHWLVAPALAWAGAPWLQGWPLRRDGARITLTVHGLEAPVARGVQALDGTLLALRRDVAQRLRFDEGFAGWHLCELEASHRAYRLGLRLSVLSPCALLADPPRPFDDAFRGEAQRFAQLHPVPPPFPHRPVPGVTAPFVDVADALSACAWLEHFCAERWRLAWELPPVPVAA